MDMIEGVATGAFTEYLQNISVMCEQNKVGEGDTSTRKYNIVK